MNGYTTIEQSKQLVSLGLKYDTADMRWLAFANPNEYYPRPSVNQSEWYEDETDVPCWSLNALVNLFPTGDDEPVFTLTRCGTDIATEQRNDDWYAEWESDDTYLVFNDPSAVGAVVKLLAKLIQDKRINL